MERKNNEQKNNSFGPAPPTSSPTPVESDTSFLHTESQYPDPEYAERVQALTTKRGSVFRWQTDPETKNPAGP
jgi:hypothetical protein